MGRRGLAGAASVVVVVMAVLDVVAAAGGAESTVDERRDAVVEIDRAVGYDDTAVWWAPRETTGSAGNGALTWRWAEDSREHDVKGLNGLRVELVWRDVDDAKALHAILSHEIDALMAVLADAQVGIPTEQRERTISLLLVRDDARTFETGDVDDLRDVEASKRNTVNCAGRVSCVRAKMVERVAAKISARQDLKAGTQTTASLVEEAIAAGEAGASTGTQEISGFQSSKWRRMVQTVAKWGASAVVFFLVAPGTFPAAACIVAMMYRLCSTSAQYSAVAEVEAGASESTDVEMADVSVSSPSSQTAHPADSNMGGNANSTSTSAATTASANGERTAPKSRATTRSSRFVLDAPQHDETWDHREDALPVKPKSKTTTRPRMAAV